MRRFASVFASKRDKSDSSTSSNVQKSPRLLTALPPTKNSLKRAHTFLIPHNSAPPTTPTSSEASHLSTPQLSSRSDPAHSSVSSTDSTSLRTPDDDAHTRTLGKRSWVAWLGRKSSSTIKQSHNPHKRDPQIPTWHPAPPPILRPPPSGHQTPKPADDTDEDTSSDSEDDDDSMSASHTTTTPTPITTNPTSIAQSRKNLQLLIQNSLVPPLSPSPFLQQPGSPMFPRSSNPPRSLPPHQTMRSTMLKTHLLRRLDHPTQSLTHADDLSISPFGSRPTPTALHSSPPSIDEPAVSVTVQVSPSSPGLHRWIARPCFEDRFAVWIPINGSISCLRVAGTAFAVAELEYSEALEVMAGFNIDFPSLEPSGDDPEEAQETLGIPEPEIPSSSSLSGAFTVLAISPFFWLISVIVPAHARNAPYKAVPSPLRNQHNPTSISPSSSAGGDGTADVPPVAPTITVKRGVRFVEDDKDDVIPIGYALRMKKRREEKAKFLREQQERRVFEEERAKVEEERRRREKERNEWEKERKAWEREKKAMEDERKQRLYAEEVAAARLRRESQRAGGVPGSSGVNGGGLVGPSSSSMSLREPERNRARESIRYSRPVYDSAQIPRRLASEPAVPTTTSLNSLAIPSPGNSRPPSIAGQSPATSGSGRSSSLVHSRPPSVYSSHTMSSSEEARPRESNSGIGKHNSIASLSSGRPSSDNRASTYPTWSASSQNLLTPPVPPAPPFVMDMPLLPPTPPFMLQQYPRQRSHHSSSPSPSNSSSSPSPRRLPSNNHSSEQVNVQQQHRQSSPRHSGTSSPSSSPRRPEVRPTHRRRFSGDSRHSQQSQAPSLQPPPHDRSRPHPLTTSRSQPNSLSRGRPPVPATMYLQTPSPWTALPSQQQYGMMPTHSNMNVAEKPPGRRRQTVIS